MGFSQNDHICTKNVLSKASTKTYYLRDFKKFDNETFMNSLQSVLFDPHPGYNIFDPDIFFQICQKVLDNHAPQKKKYEEIHT